MPRKVAKIPMSHEVLVMFAFCRQAFTSSQQRGIEFQFKFDEWVKWWEINLGPDWFSLRGKGLKQFCMARIGDSGPYKWDNVKCITNEENYKERKKPQGESAYHVKLTEKQVQDIFLARASAKAIGLKHGVTLGHVQDIKNGTLWKHLDLINRFGPAPDLRKRGTGGARWNG